MLPPDVDVEEIVLLLTVEDEAEGVEVVFVVQA